MTALEFREMLEGRIGLIIYSGLIVTLIVSSLTTILGWIIPFVLLMSLLIYTYNDIEALVILIFASIVFFGIGFVASVVIINESELNTKKDIKEYPVKLIENEKIVYGDKLIVTDDQKLYWKCKAINCTKVIETIQTREPDFVHNNLLVFTKIKLDVK